MQFSIKTSKREEIIDITGRVNELVEKNKEKGEACLIYVPHATCSIIINENYDEAVCEDILEWLRKQIPAGKWKHDKIDNNADSHIKASIIGPFDKAYLPSRWWTVVGIGTFKMIFVLPDHI